MSIDTSKTWIGRWGGQFQSKTTEEKTVSNSKMFHPKNRSDEPEVSQIDKTVVPVIRVSRQALHKMFLYVKIGTKEVGWMGTLLDNREEDGEFYLKDVFLAEQEVTSVQTNLTTDGVAGMMNELMLRPDAMEICNNLKFWGHSHVNMGVGPSGQDEDTVVDLRGETTDYFLRGIFNKRGEVKFTLFLYDENIKIDDCKWYSEDEVTDELEASIQKEFDEKVTESTFTHQDWNTYGGAYGNTYGHVERAKDFTERSNATGYWNDGQWISYARNRAYDPSVKLRPLRRKYNHTTKEWEDIDGNIIESTGHFGYVNGIYRELTVEELTKVCEDQSSADDAEMEELNQEIEDLLDDIDISEIPDDELEELSADEDEFLLFLNLKYSLEADGDPETLNILNERIQESDGTISTDDIIDTDDIWKDN